MAGPKTHILTTTPFVLFQLFSPDSLLAKGLKIIFVLFSGVLIDVDHVTLSGMKALFKSRKHSNNVVPLGHKSAVLARQGASPEQVSISENLCHELFSGWVNYFHTWPALAVIGAFSFFLGNPLFILAYLLHMFWDGANEWNEIEDSSPFPKWLHYVFFQPLGWTYLSPPEWLGKSFQEWKKEYKKYKTRTETP